MDNKKISEKIKDLRKENNLTQQEFADLFGVTYQAVSKWENEKATPDIKILREIAKKFNLDINEFLTGNKKSKKKYFIIGSIVLLLIIILMLIFIKSFNNNYDFRTISPECNNFKLTGSVAYNKNKSTIYISNIEYCKKDPNYYEKIKATLYEKENDINKALETTVGTGGLKLNEFLKSIYFKVDNYKAICNNFEKVNLYIEIEAIDKEDNITNYKIPLKLDKDFCNSTKS